MSHALRTGPLLALTLAGALATRLPGTGWVAWMGLALAAAAASLWVISLGGRRPWWAPAAFAALVGLLVLPTSPQALLRFPPALVAAPAAGFLHFAFRDATIGAPRLPMHGKAGGLRALRRGLAPALALAAAASLPWVASRVLPDRLAALSELRGALGAVVFALVLLAVVFTGVWLRDALMRDARPIEPEGDA